MLGSSYRTTHIRPNTKSRHANGTSTRQPNDSTPAGEQQNPGEKRRTHLELLPERRYLRLEGLRRGLAEAAVAVFDLGYLFACHLVPTTNQTPTNKTHEKQTPPANDKQPASQPASIN